MRYSNRDVARFFVESRGRDEIESYSQHFHFKDGILYSYSTPIAIQSWKLRQIYSKRFDDVEVISNIPRDTIFLTEDRYSQTTACHESHLRYSGNGQVCEIPTEINLMENSPAEFYSRVKEKIDVCKTKFARARKEYTREHWKDLVDSYNKLVDIFAPISFLETMKLPGRGANVNLDFAAVR